jgi:TonB family protein
MRRLAFLLSFAAVPLIDACTHAISTPTPTASAAHVAAARSPASPEPSHPPNGYATLKFCVERDGSVTHPEVIQSDPPDRYNAAAIKIIKQWKFDPRTVGGMPVRTCDVKQTLRFRFRRPDSKAR